MSEDSVRKKTQETATKLFGKGIKMDPPYLMWREFDKDLANEFSKFITGNLYSRTVLTFPKGRWWHVPCWQLFVPQASSNSMSMPR